MSQRLILKRHTWGETQSGLALVALRGSDPGDDDDQNLNGDNDSSGDDATDEDKDGEKPDEKKDDSAAEIEAMKARMKAADRRAALAEAKAKEYEDKDKTESQRLADENNALKEKVAALETKARESALNNAFLTSNDYTWQDAEAALRLADLSGVINEDGEVDTKALKGALKSLAESKPFLVKTQETDEGGGKNGSSGSSTGGPKVKKPQGLDENTLRQRYSALQSHA